MLHLCWICKAANDNELPVLIAPCVLELVEKALRLQLRFLLGDLSRFQRYRTFLAPNGWERRDVSHYHDLAAHQNLRSPSLS